MPGEENVYIVGDFNARIGEEAGITADDQDYDVSKHRRSQDKITNSEGKKFLKICDELGINILNGRANGDRMGAIAFIGGGGRTDSSTVLDLALRIGETRRLEVKELAVIPRTESDHLPVKLTLAKTGVEVTKEEVEWHADMAQSPLLENEDHLDKNSPTFKFRWSHQKAEEYRATWIKEWEERKKDTQTDRWDKLVSITKSTARLCEMERKAKKQTRDTAPWFDKEC